MVLVVNKENFKKINFSTIKTQEVNFNLCWKKITNLPKKKTILILKINMMRLATLNNNFTTKNSTIITTKDHIKTIPITHSINKKNTMLNLKAAKVFSRSKINQFRNLISKNLKKSMQLPNKIIMHHLKSNNNHNTLSKKPSFLHLQSLIKLQNYNNRLKMSLLLDNSSSNNTHMWIEKKWLWNKMLLKKKATTHVHFSMYILLLKMKKLSIRWIIFVTLIIINNKLKLDLGQFIYILFIIY